MNVVRPLALFAILATAATPALAQHMGHGGMGGGFHGGFHGGFRGGFHEGFHGGFHHRFHDRFAFGFGFPGFYGYYPSYGYPYPYAAYYPPPPPPPPPAYHTAVYYAPHPVHRHHRHRVAHRTHCTCS
jgi:hypothetical protein